MVLEDASPTELTVPFANTAGECAPGCSAADVGDGTCHPHCFHAACNYDGGDCTSLSRTCVSSVAASQPSVGVTPPTSCQLRHTRPAFDSQLDICTRC